jgi:thiamine biosynthesis lipoprotein
MSFRTTSKRYGAALGLLLAVASPGFCGDPVLSRFEFSEIHMGTRFRIVLYARDQTTASRASRAAFSRIRALDNIMTDYQPGSELMQLSQQAGGLPVKVSEDLFHVLAAAQEIARRSDGAFDVTTGPVVRLWRRARRQHELPEPAHLAAALKLVGYDSLRLDPQARAVQLMKPGMLLDLGGIGKGFAADEALAVLQQYGITSALVAGGGDIAVGSPPPGSTGWLIGIAPLESPDKPPTRFLRLRDAAVSTSGDAEQHVEIAGIRYSHIVNPKTGQALTGKSSVTVVAPNCTTSDSLATAVSVLGPQRGLELIEATAGTGALVVQQTEQGQKAFELHFPAAARAPVPSHP